MYVCIVGIAIEDQPQMFQQFAQFNRNALQGGGGSGLGLWICKNLAKFHGGRLVTNINCMLHGKNLLQYNKKKYLHTSVVGVPLGGHREGEHVLRGPAYIFLRGTFSAVAAPVMYSCSCYFFLPCCCWLGYE